MAAEVLERHELHERYGVPKQRGWYNDGRVLKFEHESREAAEAYAAANVAHHGHPTTVELDGDVWLSVIDLGPTLDRLAEARGERPASSA